MRENPSLWETVTCRYGTDGLALAANFIREGRPVAVPTETVYGLAANARDSDAVAAIYAAKGRPDYNPLIVHIADMEMARALAIFNEQTEQLAAHFWPGPLTLVLPVREGAALSSLVMAGLPTVAIRMPAHRAMQMLIAQAGLPLAAPSANRSGAISPTNAEHVAKSLGGRIAMILDDGPTAKGIESTIVAPGAEGLRLLRPGPVTAAMLEEASGLPTLAAQGGEIEAPGQMESHYAPSKAIRLYAGYAEEDEYLIGFGDVQGNISLSDTGDMEEAAANLFAALHIADAASAPRIAIAPIPSDGIGVAINDRLRRAAA